MHHRDTITSKYECRHAGQSLMATIVKAGVSPSAFVQLTGVGDSSSFSADQPSWLVPPGPGWADKCYWADAARPASDVAAQTAAALATLSKVLRKYGSRSDKKLGGLADQCEAKARSAYAAAADTFLQFSDDASCSCSDADDFCIGTCAQNTRPVRCQCYYWFRF
jgi:Glycosyl hydrolase family 9